jgi:hypothetical protein
MVAVVAVAASPRDNNGMKSSTVQLLLFQEPSNLSSNENRKENKTEQNSQWYQNRAVGRQSTGPTGRLSSFLSSFLPSHYHRRC